MSISFGSFLAVAIKIFFPVLMRARHGVGKSHLVYQIAATLGLPVIERRASQMTEGDLLGLPKVDGGVTTWLPPDWLKRACDQPVLLFFDELDRGTLEVRQGLFELADSRKIAGHHLHEGTRVFAAINGGIHGAQYAVNQMDPAELDRWAAFDLEPTVEDWLVWGRDSGKINKILLDFIAEHPDHLEHKGDLEPNKVYPSRRSWDRLNQALGVQPLLTAGNPTADLLNLSTAFVGTEAGIALQEYVRRYQKDVTAEDILERFKPEMVKDFSNVEFNSMNEKMVNAGIFKRDWTPAQTDNIVQYSKLVPSEIFVIFTKNLGRESPDNMTKYGTHPDGGSRLLEVFQPQIKEEKETKKKGKK